MKAADIIAIQSLLETPKKIVIIPHRNPDGDAMGSTLALYHYLQLYKHEVVVISPNEFPDFLAWMPAANEVLVYEKNKAHCSAIIQDAALIFTLDFNALYRTGEMEQALKTAKAPFILIDHHEKPDTYAQFTFSDTSYGSTCEMIYDFIEVLGDKAKLNKNIIPFTCSVKYLLPQALINKGFSTSSVFSKIMHLNCTIPKMNKWHTPSSFRISSSLFYSDCTITT